MHPSGTFSPPHPRILSSAPRQGAPKKRQRFIHNADINPRCTLPRPSVHDSLSPPSESDESDVNTSRPCGSHGVVRYPQPGCGAHPSTGQEWLYDDWGDWSGFYANPYSSICGRIRAITEDFSSILLDKMKPKYLILGPGGMGYFAMLGAYTKMYEELSDVHSISGASAGALLALFIAIGKSPQEIYDLSFDVNIKELVKYNIKSFLDNYGLIDHSQIREKLISICEWEPTFDDLDLDLYIAAFNVNDSKTEYFSKQTHPDMSVIDAVCMSISVPFLFSSVKYRGKVYIDGGTMECYPAPPFLNKNPNEVLVLRIITNPVSTEIKGFKSFVDALVRSTLKNRASYDKMFPTVTLDLSDYNIFDFNLSEEDKLKLFFMYTYNK
jgi:predicted acylesterase/phospholipase RssA